MTEPQESDDQKHLDLEADKVQALLAEVAQLKIQIGTQPSMMAAHLDFSRIDNLLGVKNDTSAVPDPIPSDHPSLAQGATPDVAPIGPTAPSPFVDPDGDNDKSEGPDDADILGVNTPPDNAPLAPTDGSAPALGNAAPGETSSTGEAAQGSGSTTAESVAAPSADMTPHTENPPTEVA